MFDLTQMVTMDKGSISGRVWARYHVGKDMLYDIRHDEKRISERVPEKDLLAIPGTHTLRRKAFDGSWIESRTT